MESNFIGGCGVELYKLGEEDRVKGQLDVCSSGQLH
jgi:hypothetical protein